MLMIKLAEPGFTLSPAEHDAEPPIFYWHRAGCCHVKVELTGRLDALEKKVCVPVQGEGVNFDIRI